MFIPTSVAYDMSRSLEKYQKLELSVMTTIGYTFEELVDLFAKGYTLTPPEPSASLIEAITRRCREVETVPYLKEHPIDAKGE